MAKLGRWRLRDIWTCALHVILRPRRKGWWRGVYGQWWERWWNATIFMDSKRGRERGQWLPWHRWLCRPLLTERAMGGRANRLVSLRVDLRRCAARMEPVATTAACCCQPGLLSARLDCSNLCLKCSDLLLLIHDLLPDRAVAGTSAQQLPRYRVDARRPWQCRRE